MTCREKLEKEHPDRVGSMYGAGCSGCPEHYGYLPQPEYCKHGGLKECTMCWDREAPEEGVVDLNRSWNYIRDMINDAMEKRDRSFLITFNEDGNPSIGVYPYPGIDTLCEQYEKGRITMNDFREKMGLPRIKTERKE